MLSRADIEVLGQFARDAATSAGELVAVSRPRDVDYKPGVDTIESQVVTEIDRKAERLILDALSPTVDRFDLAVLSEEQPDSGERLHKDYFWCIDPIDGTLPFIEDRPGYAVSIALVAQDGTPIIGVVHDPVTGTQYCAMTGLGLTRDGQPWAPLSPSGGSTLLALFDHSFAGSSDYHDVVDKLHRIADDIGASNVDVRPQGGAVMNACLVLLSHPACYFKFPKDKPGGGSLWDYAATACMFAEAGAWASDIHGEPLDLNRSDSPFLNHRGVLFATTPQVAAGVMRLAEYD